MYMSQQCVTASYFFFPKLNHLLLFAFHLMIIYVKRVSSAEIQFEEKDLPMRIRKINSVIFEVWIFRDFTRGQGLKICQISRFWIIFGLWSHEKLLTIKYCSFRQKKIDYLFSVERPLFKKMCALTFFIGNMPHIVFLFGKIRFWMILNLLNSYKESENHAFF